VRVVGIGARTSVGLTASATAAAIRAAIANFSQHPTAIDRAGNPFIVARATHLPGNLEGAERMAALAVPALIECLGKVVTGKAALPLFLGLPPERPGRPKDLEVKLAARLRTEFLAMGINPAVPKWFPWGHAGGTMAVQAAVEAVRNGAPFAVAGGVDSYVEPETLEWLESQDQVHSAGGENNAWGFVPGEAAGFVLLAHPDAVRRVKLPSRLQVVAAATTTEANRIKTETVCLGEGLTELFKQLSFQLSPGIRTDDLYCDMNGEPYRADEFGFAMLRMGESLMNSPGFQAPASNWGDVGAASGPLLIGLAEAAARKGYASGPVTAIVTGSESGERAGCILIATPPAGDS
jgi:3-oxoacyl-[acyl-carrier-protein] synthase-1